MLYSAYGHLLRPPLYCIKTSLSHHEDLPSLLSSSDELLVLSSVSVSSDSEPEPLVSLDSESSLAHSTLGLPPSQPSFRAEPWLGVLLSMTTFGVSHQKVHLHVKHDLHSLCLAALSLKSASLSLVVGFLTIEYGYAVFLSSLLDV